jgi:hypothetical protein
MLAQWWGWVHCPGSFDPPLWVHSTQHTDEPVVVPYGGGGWGGRVSAGSCCYVTPCVRHSRPDAFLARRFSTTLPLVGAPRQGSKIPHSNPPPPTPLSREDRPPPPHRLVHYFIQYVPNAIAEWEKGS